MKCPFCDMPDSRVLDTRDVEDGAGIRRRRECAACGKRFTSYERLEEPQLYVIKKDGRREPFDRQKLLLGLSKACEKRPVPRAQIEEIADEIQRQVREKFAPEVPSREIGEMVIARLRELDLVAYVRFASVYKEFRDAESFVEEVHRLAESATNALLSRRPSVSPSQPPAPNEEE